MNKKITVIGCVLLFMLVALPLVSAVIQDIDFEKKDSPLYGIRTKMAISEKISNIIENIKTKFLGERIFLLPFQWLRQGEDGHTRESLIASPPTSEKACTAPPICYWTYRTVCSPATSACTGCSTTLPLKEKTCSSLCDLHTFNGVSNCIK